MALAAHRHEMGLLLPPGSAREAAIVPGLSIGGGRGFAGRRSRCAEWSGYGRNTTAGDLRTGGGFPGRPPRRCEGASRCTTSARDRGSRGGHNLLFAGPPWAGKTMMTADSLVFCRHSLSAKPWKPPQSTRSLVSCHNVWACSKADRFVPPTTPSQTWPRSEAGVSRVQANSA